MLITRIKAGKFGPTTIKDIPTYIATKFYFRYQRVEKRQPTQYYVTTTNQLHG